MFVYNIKSYKTYSKQNNGQVYINNYLLINLLIY